MPDRTDWVLDLEAIRARSLAAHTWVVSGTEFVPLSVREHFGTDMPALLDRVRVLGVVMDAAVRYVAAERAVDQAQGEPGAPLMAALAAAKAVFVTAVLAALEGEPS